MRIALLTVVLVGCVQLADGPGSDTTPTPLGGPPIGVPGETIEYEIALSGLTLARMQVAVGEPGWVDGKRAIIVRSRATSAGLLSLLRDPRWELTTTIDLTTGLPLHELEERRMVQGGAPTHHRRERAWTGTALNLHAAAGALRGWLSQQGDRATCQVELDPLTIDVEVWHAGREVLPGPRPAVRYEGIARGTYRFTVWISDDDARVPLRARTDSRWGTVTMELVDYDVTGS